MEKRKTSYILLLLCSLFIILALSACKKDDDDLKVASLNNDADIFLDALGSNITFDVFSGSDTSAGFISFEETSNTANNSSKAIKAEIPASANGYASGVFRSSFGRDLSSYNVLTFYAKASAAVTLDEVGYGIDFEGDPNKVFLSNVTLTTDWVKYYIPIPDASVLTIEKGMFYYSEAEASAYTLYIDEVKFENLGTLAQVAVTINGGTNDTVSAFVGETVNIDNFTVTVNDPNAVDISVTVSSSYFDFESSDTDVATVSDNTITVTGSGTTTITGSILGTIATGSITVNSQGSFPTAPAPTLGSDSVISLFSNAYTNVGVDTWRTGWSQATLNDLTISGDDIKKYSSLSYVGTETTSNPIDASNMTHVHIDVYSDDFTEFRFKLVDFGSDGLYGGASDAEHELVFSSPTQGQWISYDIPLDDFVGLTTKGNIAQYIFSAQPAGSATVFIDNLYFYRDGSYTAPTPSEPTDAPSTPTENSANVISLFSDQYTDISVDTWRTSWSSATYSDETFASNPVKKYAGLSFAGIETTSNPVDVSGMTHIHLDIWTADATEFKLKLVDFGPTGGYSGNGGDGQGDDSEHEVTITSPTQGSWVSIDMPLSDFTGLTNTSKMAQYVISAAPAGSANVFIDNFYFYAAP